MTWQKWGSKQALEKCKTSLSLMEVFNIALECRVFIFSELLNASIVSDNSKACDVARYEHYRACMGLY
jgi:hypothetical protein